MTTRLPLVIVGHGTRSAEGVTAFCQFVERVRALAGERLPAVDGGFIELSKPSVTESVGRMPVAEHPEMVAVPLVLTAAGHGNLQFCHPLAVIIGRALEVDLTSSGEKLAATAR